LKNNTSFNFKINIFFKKYKKKKIENYKNIKAFTKSILKKKESGIKKKSMTKTQKWHKES